MNETGTLLLLATVVCDVVGQVSFKLGLERAPASAGSAPAWLASPFVWAGVVVYAAEFALWIAALSLLPLSRAIPVAALAYVGVVVASRFLLGERITARRWLGTVAVTLGVALVCWADAP